MYRLLKEELHVVTSDYSGLLPGTLGIQRMYVCVRERETDRETLYTSEL